MERTLTSIQENELLTLKNVVIFSIPLKSAMNKHIYFYAICLIVRKGKNKRQTNKKQKWIKQLYSFTSSGTPHCDRNVEITFLRRSKVLSVCNTWNIKEITYKTEDNALWKGSLGTAQVDGK